MTAGRVALVTAATSGIGRAIAERLVVSGHAVVVSGRSAERGEAAVRAMSAAGGECEFLAADALDRSQMEALVDRVIDRHGRLDVLVNNAGGSSGFAPVHELTDEAFYEAFVWNVCSAFWTTRRAMPHMLTQGFGRIVNIGSVQGKQANRSNASHYVMAKHALNGFTKAVALECGRSGITCNAVCVGAIETELMQSAGPAAAARAGISYDEYKARYAQGAMIGRLNEPEEVAAMVQLLASDLGGGITGAVLNVDGGTCAY